MARVTLPHGEVVPPHNGGRRYVYAQTACTLEVVEGGGGSKEIVHLLPGELVSWPQGRLSSGNVADSDAELLVVERTDVEIAPDVGDLVVPDAAFDMERHGTVLLDDDTIIAAELSLDELDSNPLAPNVPFLIIALSDADLEAEAMAFPDVEHVMKQGHAVWQHAGYGNLANVGEGPANVLVLGFRR